MTAINQDQSIAAPPLLTEREWQDQQRDHRERLEPILAAHARRRKAGQKHPVMDFLFEYYRFRPSKLRRWTPGVGRILENGADTFGAQRHFASNGSDAWLSVAGINERRAASTRWILTLLEATQSRKPVFGCHGLHEWAMVYRAGEVRHQTTPLRLSGDAVRRVVESEAVLCSHYDAFRFFTAPARPLNRLQPTAAGVHRNEQPGCLHANMDIYRWAMKRHPWIPSRVIADAFLLAVHIRQVDMQASPYDLRHLGLNPICIETEEGKQTYRELQAGFHRRGLPIRQALIHEYRRLLDLLSTQGGADTASHRSRK